MSAVELSSTGVVRRVHDVLSRHGLDPSRLTLEITEDVVIDDRTRDTIDRLRELGVGIAIDDFGTGNSSLRQLGLYPATTLKVDRSFVEGLGRRPQSTSVVRAILKLARALGLATIAEGVERVEQLDELRALGCDAVQGWYFEKAQPFEHLRACLLDSGRPGAVPGRYRAEREVEPT
jgi:EAL domain-containing protein (putative c-di-GMP-specific phosphodiesterase class I)